MTEMYRLLLVGFFAWGAVAMTNGYRGWQASSPNNSGWRTFGGMIILLTLFIVALAAPMAG